MPVDTIEKRHEAMKELAATLRKKEIEVPVNKMVPVHLMFDGDNKTGWVHSHFMWEIFGLPDLEIVGVSPRFLMADAGIIINHVAQYMVDSQTGFNNAKEIKLGQKFGMNELMVITFEEAKPLHPDDAEENEGHYKTPRWRIVEVPESFQCGHPNHG